MRPSVFLKSQLIHKMIQDIPSPIDLRLMSDAQIWESLAMEVRPWRTEFFAAFAKEIKQHEPKVQRILELGSGPGFLAQHLLSALTDLHYVMLDFSPAMHSLAQARLGDLAQGAEFVQRDFKSEDWTNGLGQFDAIVTMQAVHELRHKRHAAQLHAQARSLLMPNTGIYLVCDHFAGEGGMSNDQLYMSVEEQVDALRSAGFTQVNQVLLTGGMVLHCASNAT